MITISASQFWGGLLILIGVQAFSLVFERLMMYRVLRDLQADISGLTAHLAKLSTLMQGQVVERRKHEEQSFDPRTTRFEDI